ncbi:hypothetical protein EDC04DRAFT_2769081 [Pisolithus marmoratus]|nr:hypothetical protein EDC04DRAFT_2769081 [Pisolithus marmoratus]
MSDRIRLGIEAAYFNYSAAIIIFHLHSPQVLQSPGALEREVDALINLSSWRDVTVQALKQSVCKTHHKLYKIIRKFREGPLRLLVYLNFPHATEAMDTRLLARSPQVPRCPLLHRRCIFETVGEVPLVHRQMH